MSGICRATVDTAGRGPLIATQTTVFANSSAVIVNGDPVTPHGTNLHAVPVMVAGWQILNHLIFVAQMPNSIYCC